jgi:tryptophan-rich sensory protein
MLRILRMGVLVVMTFMTLSLIIALARPETGPIEKGLLVAAVVAVVLAARPVQRLASSRF